MSIAPPPHADYGFYNSYVSLAPQTELIVAFRENLEMVQHLVEGLSEEQLLYRYDTGKWNIKEVLVHLIDAERNFCYRAMRISRGDQTQIAPLSVDEFIAHSFATERSVSSIIKELGAFRHATITFFEEMHPAMLNRTGPARDAIVSVRALGYAIIGHSIHHLNIIKARYLHHN